MSDPPLVRRRLDVIRTVALADADGETRIRRSL